MKHLILVLSVLITSNFIAQTTAIPDVNFEQALIDQGLDSGTPDGVVLTSNISGVFGIILDGLSISDFKQSEPNMYSC